MSASFVESWKSEMSRSHHFQGEISDRDLSMDPRHVVAEVRSKLIGEIVSRIMEELGPRLDKAILAAWREGEPAEMIGD